MKLKNSNTKNDKSKIKNAIQEGTQNAIHEQPKDRKIDNNITIEFYRKYIQKLICNLEKPSTPKEINLVLDGGAFQGYYMLGSLLLLKELERENYIHINKISGVSIGSCCALFFLIDKLDEMINLFDVAKQSIQKDKTIYKMKNELRRICDGIHDDKFKQICKNKLYVSYNNLKKKKYTTCSVYGTTDQIYKKILRSSNVPVFTQKITMDKIKYVDGMFPYIFPLQDEISNLYVSLCNLSLKDIIYIKKEQNMDGRIMYGINDMYLFFKEKKNKTSLCSWIEKWSITDYTFYKGRLIIMKVFFYFFSWLFKFYNIIHPYIKDYEILIYGKIFWEEFVKDFVMIYCF